METWNEAKCFEAARQCNSLSEFARRFSGGYKVAKANGWIDDYKWFSNPATKWTQTSCLEAAKQCKTIKEFNTKYNRAYQVARVNGWLDTYDWLKTYKRAK